MTTSVLLWSGLRSYLLSGKLKINRFLGKRAYLNMNFVILQNLSVKQFFSAPKTNVLAYG